MIGVVLKWLVLTGFVLAVLICGIVWGGPLPTERDELGGLPAEATVNSPLRGLRLKFGVCALLISGFLWSVPAIGSVPLRYGVFVVAPLVAGVGVRRVLMIRR